MRPVVGIAGAGSQRPASRVRARSPAGPGASPQLRQSQASSFNFQNTSSRALGSNAAVNRSANVDGGTGFFLEGSSGTGLRVSQAGTNPRQRDSRLSVVVRKRPMNRKEVQAQQHDVVICRNSAVIVREPKLKVDLTRYVEEHNFLFDESFDESVNNEQLYDACVRPVIDAVFGGAKCTCFAYGQTGSGKTFTMMGPHKRQIDGAADVDRTQGIFLLAARDIFRGLGDKDFGHLGVHVAFYEIYCGKLFDLLNGRQLLHARENAKANVVIVGLQEHPVTNVQDLMEVIDLGLSSRTTGVTGANVDSSRSHAVLQICLKDNRAHDSDGKLREHGKISFIDLAGSERGADTMDTNRQTRMDGAEINKSLLALKECIRALDQQHDHTPFRGSKLTQVLKDSFVGSNCRTVMIANVSPCSGSVEHSLNTLRYAYRVKELRAGNKPTMPGFADGPLADEPPTAPAVSPFPFGSAPYGGRGGMGDGDDDYDIAEQFTIAPAAAAGHTAAASASAEVRSPRPAAPSAMSVAAADGAATAAAQGAFVVHQPQQPLMQQQLPHPMPQHMLQAHPQVVPPEELGYFASAQQRKSASMPTGGDPPLPVGGSRSSYAVVEAWADGSAAVNGFGSGVVRTSVAATAAAVASATTRPLDAEAFGAGVGGLQGVAMQEAAAAARPSEPPSAAAPPPDPGAGAGGCSQAALDELARQHDRLIGTILAEEEELITAHRQHIDTMVELIKEEMLHLNNVDRPGSDVDAYVAGLDRILRLKTEYISGIRQRVDTFKEHLQQEDALSKKFQALASTSSSP